MYLNFSLIKVLLSRQTSFKTYEYIYLNVILRLNIEILHKTELK